MMRLLYSTSVLSVMNSNKAAQLVVPYFNKFIGQLQVPTTGRTCDVQGKIRSELGTYIYVHVGLHG